ncbi:hypothetical protein DSUL_60281 [Desulfovibrionales bacterium]
MVSVTVIVLFENLPAVLLARPLIIYLDPHGYPHLCEIGQFCLLSMTNQ